VNAGAVFMGAALAAGDRGTYFDNATFWAKVGPAILETLGQVAFACVIGVAVGLPLGLAVWATSPLGLKPSRVVFRVTSVVVDLGRAIPFVCLMLLLVAVTRLLTGSSIGWQAGIPPLAVGCIPFFARLAENAIRSVPMGKIEASLMAGASSWRTTWSVAVREAAPGLTAAATVTFITLIGYSMITGTIGAGGLGDLLYNTGYTRNQTDVLVRGVIIVLAIVELAQLLGDWATRRLDHTR
jgi:D-methionine transport system permease protein